MPSHLEFRHTMDGKKWQTGECEHRCETLEAFFGFQRLMPAIQNLGSVLTKSGRLLAFSNTFQHRVQPLCITDATKPGHQKVLAMSLVGPYIHILSTANVPPQRKDWWADEV
ncbi:hypothetical protein BO70DRAFT_359478 [Aspergillus heteromorphus CBS 117.55]|uniref:DUF4246 domain-containing protein n=1 Tax=Aspergillus heteromorphus CBS 117.55 TaxID=1448321 RepID=A0A317WY91_9EURO|nr:uncharacterized protein BO70DRAFT_359478 [Aspergillus heteromorphus CBS 117.55]PWY89170.1 hypothetical protein BO70DRAFT_359478 [Aspergillus heteromorphus CBS 117.55]